MVTQNVFKSSLKSYTRNKNTKMLSYTRFMYELDFASLIKAYSNMTYDTFFKLTILSNMIFTTLHAHRKLQI